MIKTKLTFIAILLAGIALTGCEVKNSNKSVFSDGQGEPNQNLGGLVSKPYTFTSGQTIRSAEMNSNFDTLYTLVNGNISNTNIKSGAAIDPAKISGTSIISTGVAPQTISSTINLGGGLYMSTATQAFQPPSLTTTQRNALTPAAGYTIWNSTQTQYQYYDGANWQAISSGAPAYSAGNGIDITGSTVSTNIVANNGLEYSGGKLTVSTSTSVILSGNQLAVGTTPNFSWSGTHTFTNTVTLPTSTTATVVNLLPPGMIQMFASTTPPTGWLLADGTAVSRTTYSNLFAAIGTTYGVGDNSTTFNLPDFRGRSARGYTTATTSVNTIGKQGGEETHLQTVNEMPAHTHTMPDALGGGGSAHTLWPIATASGTVNTGSQGGGVAFNVLNPYLTVNYIIKY